MPGSWDCLSHLNCIGAFTLSLLLKLPLRQIRPLMNLSLIICSSLKQQQKMKYGMQ